jgi:tetratricopeptide (TPR) repeat protein
MSSKRTFYISGAAFLAMVAIFVAAIDWSKNDEIAANKLIVRTPKQSRPVQKVKPTPSPDVARVSVQTEPLETTVPEPEPPKEVTYEVAETAFLGKQYDEAVDLFTRYCERKGENPWGFYMLGLSAWKAKNYDKAEVAFGQALALDQRHVKSWINLSRVLLDTDRPAQALSKIDEALALDPESNAAYRLQGRAYHQLGQTENALDAYRQAIRIDDHDAWSMNNLALIHIEEGRFEEAVPPLARAVELRSDIAVFFNNLGMALESTGHFRAAAEAYEAALSLDGSYEKASANFARVDVVLEDPALEPVNLVAVAQRFVDEIEGGNELTIASEQPDFAVPQTDAVAVSDADSTESEEDQ